MFVPVWILVLVILLLWLLLIVLIVALTSAMKRERHIARLEAELSAYRLADFPSLAVPRAAERPARQRPVDDR